MGILKGGDKVIVHSIIETDKHIIYQRVRNGEKIFLYFAYDKIKQQSTGDEFKTITQARKWITEGFK